MISDICLQFILNVERRVRESNGMGVGRDGTFLSYKKKNGVFGKAGTGLLESSRN
jgi:hypothetical protein